MLDPSSPPSWLRPLSLRFVDLAPEYPGAAARRLAGGDAPGGRGLAWRQARSDVVHSRRTLEGLKAAGVTAVALHCDDGFGRLAQAEDLRHAAQFAATCHDLELRVLARVEGGALYYESLLAERPGLAAWAQRDAQGEAVPAGEGRPAWRPCYRSRGYLEFLKDSISEACERLQADGVLVAPFGPQVCHCERCQQAFRRRLAQAGPAMALGLASFEHTRLPLDPSPADPLHYEAAHSAVHALRSALAELRIHLRSISAHLALWAEVRLGPAEGSYTAFGEVCAPLDIITSEPGRAPGVGAGPCLLGHATRTLVYRPTGCGRTRGRPETVLGAAMAFGGQVLGCPDAVRGDAPAKHEAADGLRPRFVADEPFRAAWSELLDFAARHEHYHHRAQSLADVALVFSEADVASAEGDREEREAVEQALLEATIPYEVLPVGAAAHHGVVVVAGQRRLTDREMQALVAQASGGARVLLVGEAGTCDEYGRRRAPGSALADATRNSASAPALDATPPEAWREQLARAVRDLLPTPPVAYVSGPPESLGRVRLAPFRLPTGQATFHLLKASGQTVEGLRLHVRADLAPSRHAAWHQPGASDALLDCTAEGASVVTALPPLTGYALVITS
jgi:hypothetical protein